MHRIGNDGNWSPITLQLGTSVQALDLIPSTTGQEILVVGVEGCDGTIQCETARGGTFAANESTTFKSLGTYNLGLDPSLGVPGAGYYGLDTVTLNSEVSLTDQLIGVVNSTQYWLGSLGLGTDNTTTGTAHTNSLLESLAAGAKAVIPSLSYGFTMGASYRLKQVPSSLTLGGFDATRFLPNNASFSLDASQKPTLALNELSMTGFGSADVSSLMTETEQALFTIDSTTPFLWLPETVANRLADQLALVYNETLGVYFYPNTSQYSAISTSNLSFTFGLSNLPGSPTSLSLDIVGQAFTSMNLSFGFPGLNITSDSAPIPYFPVRKAQSSTQYTLGRALLQETYLIVDYERNNFSLSQALFPLDANTVTDLVDIVPPNETSTNTQQDRLSTAAIIGISVGACLALAFIASVTAMYLIRRYYTKQMNMARPGEDEKHGPSWLLFRSQERSELAAREFAPSPPMAMSRPVTDGSAFGYYGKRRSKNHDSLYSHPELPCDESPASELPGSPGPSKHVARRPSFFPGLRRGPVELPTLKSREPSKVNVPQIKDFERIKDDPSRLSVKDPDCTMLTVSAVENSESEGRPSPASARSSEGFRMYEQLQPSNVSPVQASMPAPEVTESTKMIPEQRDAVTDEHPSPRTSDARDQQRNKLESTPLHAISSTSISTESTPFFTTRSPLSVQGLFSSDIGASLNIDLSDYATDQSQSQSQSQTTIASEGAGGNIEESNAQRGLGRERPGDAEWL